MRGRSSWRGLVASAAVVVVVVRAAVDVAAAAAEDAADVVQTAVAAAVECEEEAAVGGWCYQRQTEAIAGQIAVYVLWALGKPPCEGRTEGRLRAALKSP